MSRTKNAKRNIFSGISLQFTTSILGFINRTIFIHYLGANYLGLSGLFTNILSVLSLAELGIGDAITFALYKPLAENDNQKISVIMSFYRITYKVIGIVIFCIGMCLLPFLKYLINFDTTINVNYYYVYILFLLNSVVSYMFFSYRISLINAAQKNYILLPYQMIFTICSYALQMTVLVIFKSYYIYLLIPILSEILKNYILSKKIKKIFSSVNFYSDGKMMQSEKSKLIKNIYALSMTKISSIIYSSSDNIIISAFISTTLVGYYSNYTLIIGLITMCANILFNSLKAGIGDLNVLDNTNHKKEVFDRIIFINRWIYYFAAICLFELLNIFISLWINKDYILNEGILLFIVLSFLIPGLNNTISIFKDACGLFWQTRYRSLMTAIVNIVSSIILVQYLGMIGVFIGTILAYLITIYSIDPVILYKEIFKLSPMPYYLSLLKSFVVFSFVFFITHFLCMFFTNITVINLVIRGIICVLASNFLFCVIYWRNLEFNYYKDKFLKKVH